MSNRFVRQIRTFFKKKFILETKTNKSVTESRTNFKIESQTKSVFQEDFIVGVVEF